MDFSKFKKEFITNIAGAILIFIGVGMYASLWSFELLKEIDVHWTLWVIPIIPTTFGSILLFAVDNWIKKIFHLSDKVSDKIIKKTK